MNRATEERIKALEVALNNEARERDFYLKHRDRTSNPLGKSMFESIANDEAEHYLSQSLRFFEMTPFLARVDIRPSTPSSLTRLRQGGRLTHLEAVDGKTL